MSAQVTALAPPGIFSRIPIAVQFRQQHGLVLRAAKARIAAFAVEDDAHISTGLAKQHDIRHGERIADRLVKHGHGRVEVVRDHAG